MAIDDPVGIVIRQGEEEIAANCSLPKKLMQLGFSAAAAGAFAAMPAVVPILTALIGSSPGRFERRLLSVCAELNAQQQRLEDKISDKSYYQSEEFQTLLGLVIEKLHTTHDEEKLRMFGIALANSAREEFKPDEKEDFIRTLRDLSPTDLRALKRGISFLTDEASLGRLSGMGLVGERLEKKLAPFRAGEETDPRRVGQALHDLATNPAKRMYFITAFGWRFFKFIAAEADRDADNQT